MKISATSTPNIGASITIEYAGLIRSHRVSHCDAPGVAQQLRRAADVLDPANAVPAADHTDTDARFAAAFERIDRLELAIQSHEILHSAIRAAFNTEEAPK